MQIWAGQVPIDEAARYTGGLTAVRAVDPDGGALGTTILDADPMITMSWSLAEEFFGSRAPMELGGALRIDAVDGPVIYILRGLDFEKRVYYLSWPD